MEPPLYREYIALKQQRKKQEAQERLTEFLTSFPSLAEKQKWVREFLAEHEDKQKIPHEIYAHLVFPVLLAGYQQKDAWSTLWLAKTMQNIYRMDALYAAIGRKSEFELLKEVYVLEPSEETRRLLLQADIQWFRYCQHEWPSGILYGFDGATTEECEEILQEIEFAKGLDEKAGFAAFLTGFEQKVREYQRRLSA